MEKLECLCRRQGSFLGERKQSLKRGEETTLGNWFRSTGEVIMSKNQGANAAKERKEASSHRGRKLSREEKLRRQLISPKVSAS